MSLQKRQAAESALNGLGFGGVGMGWVAGGEGGKTCCIGDILAIYWGYIILGIYWDDGKENGNYYLGFCEVWGLAFLGV